MKTEDAVDAFVSAYDEIADLETFPLQDYKIETETFFGNLVISLKDKNKSLVRIYFSNITSEVKLLGLKMHRISKIEVNGFLVSFYRDVLTEIDSQKLNYEGLRSVFLFLFMEIVGMQSGEPSEIIKTMSIRLYHLYRDGLIDEFTSTHLKENRIGIVSATKYAYKDELVLRPFGWKIVTEDAFNWLESLKNKEFVFRGMTSDEYNNTVGKGLPIQSTSKYSFESEGTSFAENAGDSESYVNFGRDDPRKTLKSNYLIEVTKTSSMIRDKDGYYKSKEPVEYEEINRVWEMYDKDGEVVARRIPGPHEQSHYHMICYSKNMIEESIVNDRIILTNKKVSPSSLKEYETANLKIK